MILVRGCIICLITIVVLTIVIKIIKLPCLLLHGTPDSLTCSAYVITFMCAAILFWASKLAPHWLGEIIGVTVASKYNCGVARFCHGNNFVMKETVVRHNTLKGRHIRSNSKTDINSILKKNNELLGSGFARENCRTISKM